MNVIDRSIGALLVKHSRSYVGVGALYSGQGPTSAKPAGPRLVVGEAFTRAITHVRHILLRGFFRLKSSKIF